MKLYKYRNFESFFKNGLEIKPFENIITKSSLFFAPVNSFNDPFDCQLQFKDKYTKIELNNHYKETCKRLKLDKCQKIQLKEITKNNTNFIKFQQKNTNEQLEKIGILSLSSNCKSILMWSHYSNNHSGLVFEFEPKYDDCFLSPLGPIFVDYKEEYKIFSYAVTDQIIRKKQYEELMLTKHIDWKYEEEYRVIDLDYIGEKKFRKDELTCIIFGLNTSKDNIEATKKLCRLYGFSHVKFKKTQKVLGKFALEIVDL